MKIIHELQDGSDRIFYRIKWNNKTAILLRERNPSALRTYVRIAQMLSPYSPTIYDVNLHEGFIIMEDLGDESLYKWITDGRETDIYFQVIDVLLEIQKIPCDNLPVFGEKALIKEIEYFLRWNPHMKHLEKVLKDNALSLASLAEKTFMHRDFQSRNIFIKKGRVRLIDFQSAHCGHPYYDLASLLWDPYVNLKNETRWELARYYGAQPSLLQRFAIQRLAQAIAAYRKLSRKKSFFRRFIEPATNTLKDLLKNLY